MMKGWSLICVLLMACHGLAQAANAVALQDGVITEQALETKTGQRFELPLSQLLGDSQPRDLKGVNASLDLSLPLPALKHTSEVTLVLNGTASQELNEHSQLVVSLNERVIEQYPLNVGGESFSHRINLPSRLLKPGYNSIKLRAVQHYSEQCEYPLAPQLWSQINVADSGFIIDASARPLSLQLSQLSSLFDRASWRQQESVTVFSAERASDPLLSSLGLVAQGIAQRYDFVPVSLSHQILPENERALQRQMGDSHVAVIIGQKQELSGLVDFSEYPGNGEPGIIIQRLSGDENQYLLALFADDDEALKDVAYAFAIPSVPWPERRWASIGKLTLPDREQLEQRFSIPTQTSGAFPLRALGYQSRTLTGVDADSIKLKIWNNTWQGRMQVRVHMAYASGMARQSSLNILTNGVLNGSIPMSDPRGGVYENYAVTIPAGVMRPGWNELEFQPVMVPQSNGGECQPFFTGNLATTIYADTTVQKFGGDELRQRDLSMLTGQGYLFTHLPLGKDVAFYLGQADSETLSAAMTLTAKLSQIYKRPLLKAYFGLAREAMNSDVSQHYWIGALKNLPEDIKVAVNRDLPDRVELRVPLIQSATIRVHEGAEWLNTLMEKTGLRKTPPTNLTEASIQFENGLDDTVYAISTELGDSPDHIVFTATDAAHLQAGIKTLVDYSHWGQLQGLVAFWQPDEEKVTSIGLADAPFSAFGLRGGLGLWVSQYPWRALFLLLVFLGGVIWLTRRLLLQYRRRRNQY
ncbi:MAG: cellulose biosynthesis cyclic di-GMP-binding regulatory protein BcsB [Pseudomonadota bacterium]|nr:cellulose biosynthesis cyclic di-GMP-binding regulatory protein BcsB [Pseudomonadota bacterium]